MDKYPRLAEGIEITPFDTTSPAPTYLVHLPKGKSWQASQEMHTFLQLLKDSHSTEELKQQLSKRWGREVSTSEIDWIITEKLIPLGLIAGQPIPEDAHTARRTSWLRHRPVFSENQLRPLTAVTRFLLVKPITLLLICLSLAVRLPVYLQLPTIFLPSAGWQLFKASDFILLLLLWAVSMPWHELGHLSACHRYGIRYGTAGIGLYGSSPVAYADVNASWRLHRWQRVVVDLGGIYFELVLGFFIYLLYLFTGAPVLLLAIAVIDITSLPNLNPIGRSDGYWALADALGRPHLNKQIQEWEAEHTPPTTSTARLLTHVKLARQGYNAATTLYWGYFAWLFVAGTRKFLDFLSPVLALIWQNLSQREFLAALNGMLQMLLPIGLWIGLLLLTMNFVFSFFRLVKRMLNTSA